MKPYDDKDMKYDETLGKYVLTKTGVISNVFLEENALTAFKNMSNANLFLKEMSEDIYNFILNHKFVNERKYFKHLIHTDLTYREPIKMALLYQVRYAFRSSAHTLKDMHGIDIERARLIQLDKLRGKVGISPSSITTLSTAGMLNTRGMNVYEIQVEDKWY